MIDFVPFQICSEEGSAQAAARVGPRGRTRSVANAFCAAAQNRANGVLQRHNRLNRAQPDVAARSYSEGRAGTARPD
jgi:hypothetical protein